jgi:hypothetical protein
MRRPDWTIRPGWLPGQGVAAGGRGCALPRSAAGPLRLARSMTAPGMFFPRRRRAAWQAGVMAAGVRAPLGTPGLERAHRRGVRLARAAHSVRHVLRSSRSPPPPPPIGSSSSRLELLAPGSTRRWEAFLRLLHIPEVELWKLYLLYIKLTHTACGRRALGGRARAPNGRGDRHHEFVLSSTSGWTCTPGRPWKSTRTSCATSPRGQPGRTLTRPRPTGASSCAGGPLSSPRDLEALWAECRSFRRTIRGVTRTQSSSPPGGAPEDVGHHQPRGSAGSGASRVLRRRGRSGYTGTCGRRGRMRLTACCCDCLRHLRLSLVSRCFRRAAGSIPPSTCPAVPPALSQRLEGTPCKCSCGDTSAGCRAPDVKRDLSPPSTACE